ncbi:MAG: MarR family winged helix-turn-helix transcriptional regulator [Candidatus Heimdallarchaeota archaeon]
MGITDTELTEFMNQIAIIRKLPVMKIFSKTVRENNWSEEQLMALVKILLAQDGAFVSTVAEEMYIDKPKASRLVESLVEEGLVERMYEKLSDRRKIQLKITKKGMELIKIVSDEIIQTVKEMLKDQGEHIKQLTAYLKDFNNAILSLMESMKNK